VVDGNEGYRARPAHRTEMRWRFAADVGYPTRVLRCDLVIGFGASPALIADDGAVPGRLAWSRGPGGPAPPPPPPPPARPATYPGTAGRRLLCELQVFRSTTRDTARRGGKGNATVTLTAAKTFTSLTGVILYCEGPLTTKSLSSQRSKLATRRVARSRAPGTERKTVAPARATSRAAARPAAIDQPRRTRA
jgi:hypothetical protein